MQTVTLVNTTVHRDFHYILGMYKKNMLFFPQPDSRQVWLQLEFQGAKGGGGLLF